MISGRSFRLFVISTMITHSETVILMEPPRNEAAPSKAYLITDHTALCQELLKEYKY